jgi:hypothetical protein
MGHRITRSVNQRGPRNHKFLDKAVVEARLLDISAQGARIEDERIAVLDLRLQKSGCVCHYLAKIVRTPSPREFSRHHSGLRVGIEFITLQRSNAGPRTLFDLSHNLWFSWDLSVIGLTTDTLVRDI